MQDRYLIKVCPSCGQKHEKKDIYDLTDGAIVGDKVSFYNCHIDRVPVLLSASDISGDNIHIQPLRQDYSNAKEWRQAIEALLNS